MAAETLAALAARVDALEADNARLKALGQPGAGIGVELEAIERDMPTVEVFEVRSELTRSTVVRADTRKEAGEQADRLNAQARADDVRHLGEPQRYEVAVVAIPDREAIRAAQIAALKAAHDKASDDDERAALVEQLAPLEATDG